MASSLQVTSISKHSDDRWGSWDRFVKAHPQGSPFYLKAWQTTVAAAFGHEACHLVAFDSDTSQVLGILPLFLVRSALFGRMLISTPQATYGGALVNSELVGAKLLEQAQHLARTKKVQFLELRNFGNKIHEPLLLIKDLYVTFRQELFDDPGKNMEAIPRKTRAEIREGIKNGLEFRVSGIGVNEFYEVYSQSVRALGTPVFSKKLFSVGLTEFGSQNCKIFSVHYQGKLASVVWTLFYKDEILPYYGGSLREFNHLAVNNFMYWMLMKYGCEHGYRLFDFGRSKKGTGSFNFKKRWGMKMTDLPYQYFLVNKQEMPDTSPLNPKFSLGIQIWRRLPLFVTNSVGPIISKHLT